MGEESARESAPTRLREEPFVFKVGVMSSLAQPPRDFELGDSFTYREKFSPPRSDVRV